MRTIDQVKSLIPREFIIPHLENNAYIYGQMPPHPSGQSTASRIEMHKRSSSAITNTVSSLDRRRLREMYESPKIEEISRIEIRPESPIVLDRVKNMKEIESQIDRQIENRKEMIISNEYIEQSKGRMRISELTTADQTKRIQPQAGRTLNPLREEPGYLNRLPETDFQPSRYVSQYEIRHTQPDLQANRYSTQHENYDISHMGTMKEVKFSSIESPSRSILVSPPSPLQRSITFTSPATPPTYKFTIPSSHRSQTPTNPPSPSKHQSIPNQYSKYNTKSPYAKSTFAHEVRSMDNQKYTYSTPQCIKTSQERPKSSLRSSHSHKRAESQVFMSQLLKVVECHSRCCGDLRSEVARLKRDYLPLSSKFRQ